MPKANAKFMTISKGAIKPRPAEVQHNATCHLPPWGGCQAPAWVFLGSHSTHDHHISWVIRKPVDSEPQMRADCSEAQLVQTLRGDHRPRITRAVLTAKCALGAKENTDWSQTNLEFTSLHPGLPFHRKGWRTSQRCCW